MAKPVKSTDPRKELIVAALKKLSGGNKVTSVTESNGEFVGICMKYDKATGSYDRLGVFSFTPWYKAHIDVLSSVQQAQWKATQKTPCAPINAVIEEKSVNEKKFIPTEKTVSVAGQQPQGISSFATIAGVSITSDTDTDKDRFLVDFVADGCSVKQIKETNRPMIKACQEYALACGATKFFIVDKKNLNSLKMSWLIKGKTWRSMEYQGKNIAVDYITEYATESA